MSGHRKFSELTRAWPDDRRLKVERRREKIRRELEEMELAELRRSLRISQQQLAEALGKSQGSIAQLEQRGDFKVSTLREVVEAMGGELELVARFPQGAVRITRHSD